MGNTSGKADASHNSSSSAVREQSNPNVLAVAYTSTDIVPAVTQPVGLSFASRSSFFGKSPRQRGTPLVVSASVDPHGSQHRPASAAAVHSPSDASGQRSSRSSVASTPHALTSGSSVGFNKRPSAAQAQDTVMADRDKQKDVSLPPLSASRQNSTGKMSSNTSPGGGRASPPSQSGVRPVPPSPAVHSSMASTRSSPSQQQQQGGPTAAGGDAAAAPSFITQVSQSNPTASPQVAQPPGGVGHPQDADNSPLLPPQKPPFLNRPLLVLDLDETLVHSSFRPVTVPDITLPVELHGTQYHVYVKKRPYVHEFLEAVAQRWEVCVFTASVSQYADPLLDKLDPTGTLIQHRLFRQHCAFVNGLYVKDLDRMNRPLERVVILDNSPTAYLFHPSNALPILSWFDNLDDTELRYVLPALEELSRAPNIYPVLEDFVAVLQDHESGA